MTSLLAQNYSSYLNPTSNQTFFNLLGFLDTSRSGSAQSSSGISLQTFISSLVLSLLFCVFQVTVFSLLRCKLRKIYQANCYYIADNEKIQPLEEGLFSWVMPIVTDPLENYLKFGLDSYFFLRYLVFLLVLFGVLGVMNITVLLPVNLYSGYDMYSKTDLITYTNGTVPKIQGLDRLSMSNIAPKFSDRLSLHLTLEIVSIVWFHFMVIVELNNFVKIKNRYLADQQLKIEHNRDHASPRDYSNTIFIDNIPSKLLDKSNLIALFSKVSGNKIRNVWYAYDYRNLKKIYNKNIELVDKIEKIETNHILSKLYQEIQKNKIKTTDKSKYLQNRLMFFFANLEYLNFKIAHKVIPTINYINRKKLLEINVNRYINNQRELSQERRRLRLRENGPIQDQKYNKAFIQFEDSFHIQLLNQIQISGKVNELNRTMIYVNPRDIIWSNLEVQSNFFIFIRIMIFNVLGSFLILLWVIPVAFIGLVSQLPYLTVLIPFLSWLNALPEYITDVISNFLSVILLMCLAETVPVIFRWIEFMKCKRTKAEIEMSVQTWMFVFSFVHLFLVVTISSGLTVILETLVNNPISIPNLFALNLPKCSNFFYSYMMIRGFSYSGNNLLQGYQLFLNAIGSFNDYTPRRTFERLASIPIYKWGSIYPTFSVLGSIGLIYCIVSPLIVMFCCICFFLVFISFKYSLKYQYSFKSSSENYGKIYPKAIFQLYFGIYFMEICLIGLFAISRDENDEANCLYHALLTFFLLIITAAGQIEIQKRFYGLLKLNLPLTAFLSTTNEPQNQKKENIEHAVQTVEPYQKHEDNDSYNDTFFESCFQRTISKIWIPRDQLNVSNREVEYLTRAGIECCNDDSKVDNNGSIIIENCPPDYIE